jgi:carboxyl-terminal processing protease
VRNLGDGSGLAVTIAKYLTPDGRDINKDGIHPDVEVPLTEADRKVLQGDRKKIATPEDPQYAKGYEILETEINKPKATK